VGDVPRQVFRKNVSLSLKTGGQADQLILDSETTVQGVFQPYEYDALHPGNALASATLASTAGAIVVELDTPRHIRRITLTSGTVTGSGYSLELYRLDEEVLSENPTAIAPLQNRTATIPTEFIDSRFAIRLIQTPDTAIPLTVSSIASIVVHSYPTGPRVGFAPLPLSGKPLTPIFFWQQPGEFRDDTPTKDAGTAFVQALQRYLTGLTVPLPETIDLTLIVESDAPCRFQLNQLNLAYHLVQSSFPATDATASPPEKQVLRFPGDRISTQSLPLSLPKNATITKATVKIAESFRRDRPQAPLISATSPSSEGIPVLNPILPQTTGIQVDSQHWVAQQFTPTEPLQMSGVALGVMAIADQTQLLLELQPDYQGHPSGKTVATATLNLSQVGQSTWITSLFTEPVVVQTQPHWLLVKTTQGNAIWLTNVNSSDTHLLKRFTAAASFTDGNGLNGVSAIYQILRPNSSTSSNGNGSENPQASGTTLLIGAYPVTPDSENTGDRSPSDTYTFDFTAALNQYLQEHALNSSAAEVSLSFVAAIAGSITVYPPRIEYVVA
jgi:hypothetical protein